MKSYEVQEIVFKPKVVKDITTISNTILVDVTIYFQLEFDNGKTTPYSQTREFNNLKINDIKKVISTRIASKLPILIINEFLSLIEKDAINIQDIVQNNQKIKFKISTKDLSKISYTIIY